MADYVRPRRQACQPQATASFETAPCDQSDSPSRSVAQNKDLSASVGSPHQGERHTGHSAYVSTGLSMNAPCCTLTRIMFLTVPYYGPICWRIADARGIVSLASI